MFNVKVLNSLNPRSSPYRIYEKSNRPGFGIQVSTKGTKTFFYAYKNKDKKQRFIKLGIYGNDQGKIKLKEAGELWDKWHKVRQSGRDPQIVRDNLINEEKQQHKKQKEIQRELSRQGSFEELLNAYIENLRRNEKTSVDNVIQALNSNVYKVIARSTKAKEVTLDDINQVLMKIEKRGSYVMSNRVRAYLSAAFTFGINSDNSRLTSNITKFGISYNPVRDVPKAHKKEVKGDRFLSEKEVNSLWYSIDETNISSEIKSIIKLLICTGQRVSEVRWLNINDIDFENSLWTLEQTKSNRVHVVVLPHLALDIIKKLRPSKSGLLVSSQKTGRLVAITSISQSCDRFCKIHNFEKFTPKDLRRTWKTLGGKAGISKIDRDRYQNHAMNDVSSEHYDRYDYIKEKKDTAQVWNTFLENILYSER